MRTAKEVEKKEHQELLKVQEAFRALISQLLVTSPQLRSLSLSHEQLHLLTTFLKKSVTIELVAYQNIDLKLVRPTAHNWPQTERLGKTYAVTIPSIGKIIVSHYRDNLRVLGMLENETMQKFGFSDRNHPHLITIKKNGTTQTTAAPLTELGGNIFTSINARQISTNNMLYKSSLLVSNNLVKFLGLQNIYLAGWSDSHQTTAIFYFPVHNSYFAFKKIFTHNGSDVWAEIDARPAIFSPEKETLQSDRLATSVTRMKPAL